LPEPPDIQRVVDELVAAEHDAEKLVAGLTEEQGSRTGALGSWSVAECLEHLAIFNLIILRAMQSVMERARSERRMRRGPASSGIVSKLLIKLFEPPVRRAKFKTDPRVLPRQTTLMNSFLALKTSQVAVRDFLMANRDLDLNYRFPMPFVKLRIPLVAGFLAIAAHERRHLWQGWRAREAAEPQRETMQRRIVLLMVLFVSLATLAGCRREKASPAAFASCDPGAGKTVKTAYSSPRMKGRKIYGGLVPFGEVWRTGANAATTFVTTNDIVIGGTPIPAGSYTIFTVPTVDKWTLIINKKTGEWGIPYKYEADELARVDMTVAKLLSPVEDFTISYEKYGVGCTMNIDWDTTRASVVMGRR